MAEIYVPGPFDFVGTVNSLSQLQSGRIAQENARLQQQYTMEDRARAAQERKAAAGNALAEQARKRELLEIYSNFGVTPAVIGQRGQSYSGAGVANDPYADIQNKLLTKGFASQAGDIAELQNKNLLGKKTEAETAEKTANIKGIDIKNVDARLNLVKQFANSVTTPDSAANFARIMAREFPEFAELYGSPEDAAARSAELFDKDPAAWQAHSVSLTGEQLVQATERAKEAKTAKPVELDIGGRKIFVDMNPDSPTFKQELTGFDKTLTPAEAKPAAVTPTNLAKLITERDALPEGSADKARYDLAIAKELAMSDVAQTDLGKAVSERAKLKQGDPLIAQYDAYIAKLVSATTATTIPAGYRLKPNGDLEYIPGGPADPKVASKSTPAPSGYRYKTDGSGDLEATPGGPEAGKLTVKSEDAIVAAEDLVGKIEDLLKHPGKSEAVGISFGSGMIPGTAARGFISRHDEIKGSAFLDAYNSLRGTGSITEIEGVKATAAKNRMDLSTSEEEYETAAKEYMGYIKRGIEREKARMQKLTGGADATSTTQAKIARNVDIEHTAKQNSMSVEDTKARLRSMGYKIEGE